MNTPLPPVAAQHAQPVRYSNRFGTAEVTPVTPFMPVSSIRKTHPQAQENTFDLTTAEKIALITENRGIQLCPHFPIDGLAYLVLHDSPSMAAICRVNIEDFVCASSPADMIEALSRHTVAMVY
jgi:hypothetical protein